MKTIRIKGSKSISNRLLIINALYGNKISIENLSTSQDTAVLANALSSTQPTIDIHHAGTAMRFLTAYLSTLEAQDFQLTGSSRMQERPIGILVDALKKLGANIEYEKKTGYPPLIIKGEKLKGGTLEVNGSISSQFLSALILIGSKLENGLEIEIEGELVSKPYLEMTITLQNQLGIPSTFCANRISIPYIPMLESQTYFVESDWSSASYFYESLAILKKGKLDLEYFWQNSLQADEAVVDIYEKYFGVQTNFVNRKAQLKALSNFQYPSQVEINCQNFPDIAQTICVTAAALQIPIQLTGLQTLTIKESNRIEALKNELAKFAVSVETSKDSLQIKDYPTSALKSNASIDTYKDHRMAMAFAPLQFITEFEINEPNVVEKSYPEFWNDFNWLKTNKD